MKDRCGLSGLFFVEFSDASGHTFNFGFGEAAEEGEPDDALAEAVGIWKLAPIVEQGSMLTAVQGQIMKHGMDSIASQMFQQGIAVVDAVGYHEKHVPVVGGILWQPGDLSP